MNMLNAFILRDVFPVFRARLKDGVNRGVLASLAGMIAPGTTTMPAGIVVSARTIRTTRSGITVRAALGAFGGVFSKLPRVSSTGRCFIATAAYSYNSHEVLMLQIFRDQWLTASKMGRIAITVYEHLSPPLAKGIAKSELLRRVARRIIVNPACWFAMRIMRSVKKEIRLL